MTGKVGVFGRFQRSINLSINLGLAKLANQKAKDAIRAVPALHRGERLFRAQLLYDLLGQPTEIRKPCATGNPGPTKEDDISLISLCQQVRGDDWAVRKETHSRSEEHTSELQSLMRTSYAVFCLKKKKNNTIRINRAKQIPSTRPTT